MSGPAVVHLVRHGEVHNPQGVLYERLPDFHLSDRGRQMANLVADWFASRPLDLILSSPLDRARETAALIAAAQSSLAIELDERLIEAANAFAGQRIKSRSLVFLKPTNLPLYRNPFRPSWGEPYVQVADRMMKAVLDAADRVGPAGQAVLVSHQSPIWLCRLAFAGKRLVHSPLNRECRLASVTSIKIDDGQCVGIDYAEPAAELYDTDSGSPFSSGGARR